MSENNRAASSPKAPAARFGGRGINIGIAVAALVTVGGLALWAVQLSGGLVQTLSLIHICIAHVRVVCAGVLFLGSAACGEREGSYGAAARARRGSREVDSGLVQEKERGQAVSYTHLDVYKRQHIYA